MKIYARSRSIAAIFRTRIQPKIPRILENEETLSHLFYKSGMSPMLNRQEEPLSKITTKSCDFKKGLVRHIKTNTVTLAET